MSKDVTFSENNPDLYLSNKKDYFLCFHQLMMPKYRLLNYQIVLITADTK